MNIVERITLVVKEIARNIKELKGRVGIRNKRYRRYG